MATSVRLVVDSSMIVVWAEMERIGLRVNQNAQVFRFCSQ